MEAVSIPPPNHSFLPLEVSSAASSRSRALKPGPINQADRIASLSPRSDAFLLGWVKERGKGCTLSSRKSI
jgi:hypothetical protein